MGPGQHHDHTFRETLSMGYTAYSPEEVVRIIHDMGKTWTGGSYDLLTRNCHSFSDELCRRLGCQGLPPWVNALAGTGAAASEYLDEVDSGYDGGQAIYDLFGAAASFITDPFGTSASEHSPQHAPRRIPSG